MKRKVITLSTIAQQQFCDITAEAQSFITKNRVKSGIFTVKTLNTTTAIYINENEQGLLQDLQEFLLRIVPNNYPYHHDMRLNDNERRNGFAHLQSIVLNNGVTLSIIDGQITLGTYQSILFLELDGPRANRQLELLIYDEELQ